MSTVLITGGSRGLGLAIVERLLFDTDFNVICCARKDSAEFKEVIHKRNFEDRVLFVKADVSKDEDLPKLIESSISRFGKIDALINNAGIARDGVLATFDENQIDQLINVDLRAAIVLTKLICRHMLTARQGRIINISSVAATKGFAGLSVYAAAKSGLEGFTRSLARELGPAGILVNCIAPGYLKTEMTASLDKDQLAQIQRRTPLGRLGEANDVAGVVKFLLSADASFITGQTFVIDGGLSL